MEIRIQIHRKIYFNSPQPSVSISGNKTERQSFSMKACWKLRYGEARAEGPWTTGCIGVQHVQNDVQYICMMSWSIFLSYTLHPFSQSGGTDRRFLRRKNDRWLVGSHFSPVTRSRQLPATHLWLAILVSENTTLFTYIFSIIYSVLSFPVNRDMQNDVQITDRLCGLVVRVPGYRSRGSEFDSRRCQNLWEVVGLERGPLSLLRIIKELLERNVAAPV
jgi:hypothetical protein